MTNLLEDVYTGPNVGVRSAPRNIDDPWDINYQPYPFIQSAYNFWHHDVREDVDGDVIAYNNAHHVPGDIENTIFRTHEAYSQGEAQNPNQEFFEDMHCYQGQPLPAVNGHPPKTCYNTDELISGYSCVKFMPDYKKPVVATYHQEELPSPSNIWDDIQDILIIAGVIVIVAILIMILI